MHSLFYVIYILLDFLQFMMGVYGIVSLLVFFGIMNPYGRITGLIWQNLQGLFEPFLQPMRRYIPPYRGFDWSFMVFYLLVVFVQHLMVEYHLV